MVPKTLSDFTGPSKESGAEVHFMVCPVCGSDRWNTYLNTVTGKWFCHANNHGGGGSVEVNNWTDQARAEMLQMLDPKTAAVPVWSEVDLPAWKQPGVIASNYLKRRGVELFTCATLGIVEMCVSPRILIPYKGPLGRIIHWTGRAFADSMGDVPKYLLPPGAAPLFMLPDWKPVERAVIVEGVFDAIAVWQATKLPVIAIGGKSLSKRSEADLRQLVREDVIVLLDGNAVVAAMDLKRRLMDRYPCRLALLPDDKDPGDSSVEVLRKVLL